MPSPQTLSDDDRRVLARWASECAGRVVDLFVGDDESVRVVRDALGRTRAYARGESTAAREIARRMEPVTAAGAATTPAGAAAARAVAQASAVAHMGAHALGAAGYAAKAVALARPGDPDAVAEEARWQLDQLMDDERRALARLPALGSSKSGPLGAGLLTRGVPGDVIRAIQRDVGTV